MRQTVFGDDSARFLVTDSRIVNDCIESAERINLFGQTPSLSDARKITNDRRFCSRNRG